MTREQVLAEILKLHDVGLASVEGSMVTELWEDGEITLTKSGSIFRCRGLHMMRCGMVRSGVAAFFREGLPMKSGGHSSAYIIGGMDAAERLADLMETL